METKSSHLRRAAAFALACACVFAAGCAGPQSHHDDAVDDHQPHVPLADSSWARASGGAGLDPLSWEHQRLPGKAPVTFRPVRLDGRDALSATAVSAASVVRNKVRIEPQELAAVRFSWKVPALTPSADLALRDADDSPVRIILAFEGDRSKFSTKNAMLSELMRALTGEEMPYATLMYVWCNKRQPGTVIPNPRTDRIRTMVLESGPGQLGRWLDYERNIRADFEKAFGEAPGALVGVAVMTDSDNTRSTSRAWYGPLTFTQRTVSAAP
ncbi:DUF3047 domain-containing protein [Ramlibacter humi]|uniref:DUF3047 domain-containing protein n=1 Tax=Ramlibacter humi TaxID=2530451 RepID=UPI001EF0E150|nr:DUF3047 domain-containing protein [Ramlibacter humi]